MTDFERNLLNNYDFVMELYDDENDMGSKVHIVRDNRDGKLYIKKILKVYNKAVLNSLLQLGNSHIDVLHVYRFPRLYHIFENDDCDVNESIVIEDYINCQNLANLMEVIPVSIGEHLEIFINLCDVVIKIHSLSNPIIHNDIKPLNILVDTDKSVYLIDFNASSYIETVDSKRINRLGTIGFAAPEQYGLGRCDMRTDVYGIGASLDFSLRQCIVNGGVDVSGIIIDRVIKEIQSIIRKAKSNDPKDRYQDVNELKDALIRAEASLY